MWIDLTLRLNNMLKDGKILIIFVLLGYIFYLQQCGRRCSDENTNVSSDTVVVSTVDTIQLPPVTRYVRTEIPVPVVDTIVIGDTIIPVNSYNTPFSDSLIDGNISSKVRGMLLEQNFSYVPRFPKFIIRTDSVFIHGEKRQFKAYLGLSLGFPHPVENSVSNRLLLTPNLLFSTKNDKYQYGYGFDVLNKVHVVSFHHKISFRKKR